MSLDNFKQVWRGQPSQTRLKIDPELLLNEVRRNQRRFAATIFWRDVREVSLSLLMLPLWLFLGVLLSLPWTWYLTVPVLLWTAGYMLAYRMRHRRRSPDPGDSLREAVERSLVELDQQIRLLRSVFWWGLLPFLLSSTAFFLQSTLQDKLAGWLTLLVFAMLVAFVTLVLATVYWLNQHAIRSHLLPRRRELEALLASLADEKSAASAD